MNQLGSRKPSRPSNEVAAARDAELPLRWKFRVGCEAASEWLWQDHGAPPLDQLRPVRRPRSSERNRHIPATVYSMTNGDFVSLESGLEHDLVRRVDRDPTVTRIVAQPFELFTRGSKRVCHTPDLLSAHASGTVVVWDVRPLQEQDDTFLTKADLTRLASEAVGWRYEIFTGINETERLNMLWLYGFRRRPPWAGKVERRIDAAATCSGATLGTIMALDDGSGEVTSAMWHMLWSGQLVVDEGAHWTPDTAVAVRVEPCRG
ncbi:TnsA-like heteromeric transposase endonuclease subunit [Mycobacterium sp. AT1]|uniref:TnsA-like heteromeric transposase endonuclease subunit n=1 Tax=Mycobacterium sp. AT1 TaxID=1961706 RepID=UPI0009AE4F84|nr:TnsA-like heteromeric transposase endonuclease subunit [Mycobacterium sp. AT1]OPX11849.1 hypothetical protein B1790_06360 [Mycobacterium sp. AT1]